MDRLKHQTFAQRFLNCVNGIICSLNFYIAAPSINDLWGEFICFLNDPNCVARSWDENHWNAQKTPQQRHISSYCTFRLDRKQIRVFSTWFPSCIIAGKTFTILHTPSPHVFTRGANPGNTFIHIAIWKPRLILCLSRQTSSCLCLSIKHNGLMEKPHS